MPDPYQILGVTQTASVAEIKKAYHKLAKKLHPDVNPGRKDVEQKFKEITAAYDLLSDPPKRARYDRGEIDAQGQEKGFGGGPYGYGGFKRGGRQDAGDDPFASFGSMDDIFAEFMGGTRGRRGAKANIRGSDVNYSVNIPFAEAVLGGKKRVTLTNDKTLDITIPPGVTEGHKLRLKNQGLEGMGGPAGDAIIELHIEPHPFFTRKDRDIHLELPISLSEAVLGASVTVPSLDGRVSVKIPKGANSGTTLRLKGKGVGGDNGGDMFVKLKVVLPDPIPEDLSEFVEKWAKKNTYNPRKKTGLD